MRFGSAIFVITILAACNKTQGTETSTPTDAGASGAMSGGETTAEAPEPEPLPLEQRIVVHDQCFEDFLKEDMSAFARCYGPESTDETIDSGEPAAVGVQQIQDGTKRFWDAFTFGGEPVITLGNGEEVVGIYAIWGTHDGTFGDLPATNKKIGMYVAEVQNLLADGKHGRVRFYMDAATLMAQLGTLKAKVRPVVSESGAERVLAIASGSEVETANVDTVKQGFELWNSRDLKGLEALYATDAVLKEQPAPADVKSAKKIIANFKQGQKAFSDGKLGVDKIWAAGDWVVAETTFTGTNDGVWPQMGIKKKTGKPVTLHQAHVFMLAEGKVKEHWVFGNGMALLDQLGLLPAPKPAKTDEKAAGQASDKAPDKASDKAPQKAEAGAD